MRVDDVIDIVRKSGLVEETRLAAHLAATPAPPDAAQFLETLVQAGLLTPFHVRHLLDGKYRGFFLGPYKVLRPLAKGGMAMVYLAEDTALGRLVALKICWIDQLGDGGLERFRREARIATVLDHPNIVRVYDINRDGNTHFLIMEYIEGKSLEQLLHEKGRFPVRQAVGHVLQVARGLAYAHECGLVHRDIKPANLLVTAQGVVKILDLGLARFFGANDDKLTERLGRGPPVLGSPDYISPEQALGQLDIRSDIYSLGATLYALISGQPPFPGKTAPQKLLAHQLHQARPLHLLDSAVPVELSVVVLRMLAKIPANRFQTPGEVIEALSPWGAAEQPPSSPLSDQFPVRTAPV